MANADLTASTPEANLSTHAHSRVSRQPAPSSLPDLQREAKWPERPNAYPDEFAVTLKERGKSDARMRPGDTLFMRPFTSSVEVHYLPVVAQDLHGSEFLTEYDADAFSLQKWKVTAYTVGWLPRARKRVLAVVPPHLIQRPAAGQGVA